MSESDSAGIEYLYETPETGKLMVDPDTGKASRGAKETSGERLSASLEGPVPRYGYGGQKGISGTVVSDVLNDAMVNPNHPAPHPAEQQLSPKELMDWADREEQALVKDRENSGTAVDSTIIRTRDPGQSTPDWLEQYMSKQAFTDPYHQVPMSGLDRIKMNKYLTDQEKVKMLRDEQRKLGLK